MFVSCTKLSTFNIGSKLKKIGSNVFNYCATLKTITYDSTLAQWQAIEKGSNWDGRNAMDAAQSLIHSSDSDTTVRATTVPVTLHVRPTGFDGESCNVPPTPDLYEQLLAEMKKLLSEVQNGSNGTNGKDGENGLSAYELAVQNGFTGTLTEWLNSLKGADGKDGVDGKDGADGKNGIDGVNGKDGIDGKDGADGRNGTDGKDGLSAYEIALKNGFVGTESEWLDSLKGKDSADGTSPEV